MNNSKNMGFSLMEMMVVVAILGIIAAIALPSYQRYVDNARLTQARTVVNQLQQTIQKTKLREGTLGANGAAIEGTVSGVLTSAAGQGIINENDLGKFFSFGVSMDGNNYFINALPLDATKKGVYVDQAGNAFKCNSAAEVVARAATCQKM